jgi:ribosomal protein S18 acetylase RimI-like enzyme
MTDVLIDEAMADQAEVLALTGQRLFVQTYGNISGAEDLAAHLEDYFSQPVVMAELENPDIRYFLARDGDDIAGYLKIRRGDVPDAVPATGATEVQQLYVDADHQRKGIGRLLMDRAVSAAREDAQDGVWLSVWEEADWAIHFYQAYGFHTVGTTDFRLGKSVYKDYLMWFPIKQ